VAQPVTSGEALLSEEAFLADRQHFWAEFTGFTLRAGIVVAVVLSLMAMFLV
jgi:hypothetical protein